MNYEDEPIAIANSVVALLRNAEQLAILRADADRIAAAVEESLRYDAPVPRSTFRYASHPSRSRV